MQNSQTNTRSFNRSQSPTQIINLSELQQIHSRIFPNNTVQVRKHGKSEWATRAEQAKNQREQNLYDKFRLQEEEKRKLDQEEEEYQNNMKKLVIQDANQKIFMSKDNVRRFKSALFVSQIEQENKFLQQINLNRKEMNKQQELQHYDQLLQQVQQAEEKEQRQIYLEAQKNKQWTSYITQQEKERMNKKIDEIKGSLREGELFRNQAKNLLEEANQSDKLKAIKAKENKISLQKQAEEKQKLIYSQLQKEEEDDKKIDSYLRNSELLQQKIEISKQNKVKKYEVIRDQMIHQQVENLKDKDVNFEQLIVKSQLQKQQEEDEKLRIQKEKVKKLESERIEFIAKQRQSNVEKKLKENEQILQEQQKQANILKELEQQDQLKAQWLQERQMKWKNSIKFEIMAKNEIRSQKQFDEQQQYLQNERFQNQEYDLAQNWAKECIKNMPDSFNLKPLIKELKKMELEKSK